MGYMGLDAGREGNFELEGSGALFEKNGAPIRIRIPLAIGRCNSRNDETPSFG